MLTGQFDELAWRIVSVLLDEGELKVSELDARLSLRFGGESSMATLYRRIAELRAASTVFTHRRRVSLNPVWVEQMARIFSLFSEYSPKHLELLLPRREGERREFRARSLIELDPLWNALLFELGSRSRNRELCGFNARAWYPLAVPESENALYTALERRGVSVRLLFGRKGAVDELGSGRLSKGALRVAHSETPMFRGDDYFAWASGEYLVEFRLPRELCGALESICGGKRRPETIDPAPIAEVFRRPASLKLTVHKSARRAREFAACMAGSF